METRKMSTNPNHPVYKAVLAPLARSVAINPSLAFVVLLVIVLGVFGVFWWLAATAPSTLIGLVALVR